MSRSTLLVLPLLATALAAQGTVPPPILRAMANTPAFNPPSVPGSGVHQIHLVQLPGDRPGLFTVGLTVESLSTAFGGVASTDLLTGKYDSATKVFTPDVLAIALNSGEAEFGLMLHGSGLLAAFDITSTASARQGVYIARRQSMQSAWQLLGKVGNLPSQSYFDPALAQVNGKLHLLHVLGTDIAMSPLDITNLTVGAPKTIVRAAMSGGTANSPTPIVDSFGELIGISHHEVVGSDNDHYFSMDLDPLTPAVLFHDTTTWTNNGGFIAGTIFDAEYTPSPYHIFDLETAWWTGGRAPLGGTMEVTACYPIQGPASAPAISFFFMAKAFLAAPFAVPGFQGLLGVDPTLLLPVNLGVHNQLTGLAVTRLPVPADPVLSGLAIPAQSVTMDPAKALYALGNTAALTIL